MNPPREPRTPLKEIIKRAPGQSAQELMDTIINDRVLAPALVAVSAVLIAAFEWYKTLWQMPPQPWLMSALALLAVGYAYLQFKKHRTLIAQIRLGMEGEREVGQILSEELADAAVFHDIVCDGFNIDHCIVAPTGVFSVETKTRKKRGGAEEQIVYDGEKITVAGFEPERDAVVQAQANAKTLAKIIYDVTGQKVMVQPVVVFPGWWVNTTVKKPAVWVLNPTRLLGFIRHEPVKFTAAQIHVISEGLKRHQAAVASLIGKD